jgi:hypothetical protein
MITSTSKDDKAKKAIEDAKELFTKFRKDGKDLGLFVLLNCADERDTIRYVSKAKKYINASEVEVVDIESLLAE